MAPWKGYYVYNLSGDTAVQLSSRPPSVPFSIRREAVRGEPHETALVLSFGDAPPVKLAASPASRDEVGWEDELPLPAFASGHRFQAVRQGTDLSCGLDPLRAGRHPALERVAALARRRRRRTSTRAGADSGSCPKATRPGRCPGCGG